MAKRQKETSARPEIGKRVAFDRATWMALDLYARDSMKSFQELADFGYRMVIYPMSAFRVAMKASEQFLRDLKERGTQSDWIERMQTREELYDLLDYDPAAENWPSFRDR